MQLRDTEARLGGDEVAAVDVEIDVDPVELDVREVVGLDRVPELGVHLPDLGDDRARLILLGADRGIRGRGAGASEGRREARECDHEDEALSLRRLLQTAGVSAYGKAAAWGVAGHKSGSLAAGSDDCTPMRRQNLCKHGESSATVVRPVSRRARYLAPSIAALLLGSACGVAAGSSGSRELAALAGAERSAELELYASESALARALGESRRLDARLLGLERSLARARTRSTVVRASLATTRRNIATLLERLYVEGEAEPLAVLFGARSLEGVIEGIDVLERATSLNRRLAAEARERAVRLDAELARLTVARVALDRAQARARAAAESHVAAAMAKRDTLDAIRREQGLTRERLAAAEARAQAAQRASARIGRAAARASSPRPTRASSRPAAAEPQPGLAPPRAAGPSRAGRQFVADAVAYHLPGRTASGLPVGVGVIAVDPTVIPLGTRVFVPGYGPAVAADVGSAIKGNIIDLWMPSTAAARAWGRRTVTITIYR